MAVVIEVPDGGQSSIAKGAADVAVPPEVEIAGIHMSLLVGVLPLGNAGRGKKKREASVKAGTAGREEGGGVASRDSSRNAVKGTSVTSQTG